MKILDGKIVAKDILNNSRGGSLAILSSVEDPGCSSYVKGIIRAAKVCDADLKFYDLSVVEDLDKIKENGILVLTPLPAGVNKDELYNKIPAHKDVDSAGKLSNYHPCTAEAIIKVLDFYKVALSGSNVVVVGRSDVVGKPVSAMLTDRDATVTLCHSKTRDLAEITRQADIVVCAIGKPRYFTQKYFNEKQVVIDAGINWDEKNNRLCGDCDYDLNVAAITPVPGGIGAVTSAVLMSHCV